jgi:hypothetical protein
MMPVLWRRRAWAVLFVHAVTSAAYILLVLTYTLLHSLNIIVIQSDVTMFITYFGILQLAMSGFACLSAGRLGYRTPAINSIHSVFVLLTTYIDFANFVVPIYITYATCEMLHASCLTLYDASCKLSAHEVLQLGCGTAHAITGATSKELTQ